MFTFLKAQTASLTASLVDFFSTIILVEVFHLWYLAASITGTILGGITSFLMGRVWVFDNEREKIPEQALRYLLVWVGNFFLTTTGVFAFTHALGINYIVSKVAVSVVMGVSYNYLLQKEYVFK